MVKIDRKCVECGGQKTKKDKPRKIYLCDGCAKTDKYALICKTDIKNKYFITYFYLKY